MADDTRDEDDKTTFVVANPRERAPQAATEESCLVTIYGPDLGRKIPLNVPHLTIGRGSKNDVVVRLKDISRHHCRISIRDGNLFVCDLDSTNGTYLNDEALPANREVPLRTGDHINLGGAIFKMLDGGNVEALYHEEIYRTAIFDGLTQIPNRRYLTEFLEREMARSSRHGRPLALLLLDVDHFKEINDELGHVAGDQVLRELARVISESMRKETCFARYGGEEFAVVLPETDESEARIVAERVRSLVESHVFHIEDQEVRVTVSVGVAVMNEGMRDPIHLFHRADEQLYEAKHSGRNTIAG